MPPQTFELGLIMIASGHNNDDTPLREPTGAGDMRHDGFEDIDESENLVERKKINRARRKIVARRPYSPVRHRRGNLL